MHVFGIIAHPFVTVLWAIEQVSIHVLGTSPRASDSRIVMGLLLNVGFVAICTYCERFGAVTLQVVTALLAFVASNNVFGSLGIKKPLGKVNERLKSKKAYADIVFEGK